MFVYDPRIARNRSSLYAYAPSVIRSGERDYVFSCHNNSPGEIKDSIFRFTRDRTSGLMSAPRQVLAAAESCRWDGYHHCDPSVVKGRFGYGGRNWAYAMFYTGNSVNRSRLNLIGVAFADDLEAEEWVSYPYPVIKHCAVPLDPLDPSRLRPSSERAARAPGAATAEEIWGIGQPSAINLERDTGRLLLAYTVGGSRRTLGEYCWIDLSDLDRALVVSAARSITPRGLTDPQHVVLRNFDLLYDAARDEFLITRDLLPSSAVSPTFLSSAIQIATIPRRQFFHAADPAASWRVLATITAEQLAAHRAHDSGWLRDEYGHRPPGPLTVAVSACHEGPSRAELWTSRICFVEGLRE